MSRSVAIHELDSLLPDRREGEETEGAESDEVANATAHPLLSVPDPREGEDTEDLQEGEVKDRAPSERPGENTADAPYG
jgi:hypothetical protein